MFKSKWTLILSSFLFCVAVYSCKSSGSGNNPADGLKSFDKNNDAASAAYYEKILEKNPDQKKALIMSGWSYFKLERYEEALMAFEHLLETDKNSFDALEGIGWSTFKLGNFKRSLSTFETMLKKKPAHSGAVEGVAYSHFKLGNLEKAGKYLAIALKKNPSSSDNHVIRGYIAFAQKDWPVAIKYFKSSMKLAGKPDSDTLAAIGNVFLAQKDYNKADSWFTKALKQDRQHPGASAGKIKLTYIKRSAMAGAADLFAKGSYSESIKAYEKVEQKYPSWSEIQEAKGWGFYKLDQYQTARKAFKKSVDLNPYSYNGYDGLGWSLLKLGQKDEARDAFKKALELYPGYYSSTTGLEKLQSSDNKKE